MHYVSIRGEEMLEIEPPAVPMRNASLNSSKSSIDTLNNGIENTDASATANNPQTKKQGFFSKLFSKKQPGPETPGTDAGINLPEFPPLPDDLSTFQASDGTNSLHDLERNLPDISLDSSESTSLPNMLLGDGVLDPVKKPLAPQKESKGKTKGKAKGKRSKDQEFSKSYEQASIAQKFDWSSPIGEQQNLITDSNRNNSDINVLLENATAQVLDQLKLTKDSALQTEHETLEPQLPQPDEASLDMITQHKKQGLAPAVQQASSDNISLPFAGAVDSNLHKSFVNFDKEHQKIRKQLADKLRKPNYEFNKKDMLALLKQYDEHIEDRIESKETELNARKSRLDILENVLAEKDRKIKGLMTHTISLNKRLKEKESAINKIIADSTAKQLSKRLSKEKSLLKKELIRSMALNKTLKKNLDILDRDRQVFEKNKQKVLDDERSKLTHMQEVYEKKLAELELEKKQFESFREIEIRNIESSKQDLEKKKSDAISILEQADVVSRELHEIEQTRQSIDKDKKIIKKEISVDKQLQESLKKAQDRLKKDRENMDKMMFSKYIESKLKEIKPEPVGVKGDAVGSHGYQIYSLITTCRNYLSAGNIVDAKKTYNSIKGTFESASYESKEKEILYNIIKELYNEIQLTVIERQLK